MSDIFSQFPETALLSILLRNPELIHEASEVTSYMFTSSPNKNIYEVLRSLLDDGLTPDFGLLTSRLQEHNVITQAGDTAYIKYLYDQNYSPDHVKEYVNYVVNAYKARRLLSMASTIPSMVSDISTVDGVISDIRDSLDKLATTADDNVYTIAQAAKSAWDSLMNRMERENPFEITTGINKLNAVTGGYWEEDLWVVAGRPGMGKSAYMCNSVLSGVPSLIFSLEMSKESLLYRLISMKSGVPIFNLRLGQLNQEELDKVAVAVQELKQLPIYIDTTFMTSVDSVVSLTKKYNRLYGIKVVHLDYIQILADRGNDATHEIGRISRAMKNIAHDLNIASVVYSQLNRNVESRDDKRPMLADLRQSGNLEEDADVVMFLYRDEMYNPNTKFKHVLELLVKKQRNGPTGVVTTLFNDQTNKITEQA